VRSVGIRYGTSERSAPDRSKTRDVIPKPDDSIGYCATPGSTVTMSVVATISQMAESVSTSNRGFRATPASEAASSRIIRSP
jgi:hypothetical protein